MKKVIVLAQIAVALLAGSLSAHEGMLALYSDMDRTATIGAIPAGGTYNLELFYVKGDGPFIGVACEFRLSLSTEGAAFLDPVWSEEVEVTLGSIAGGIALTGDGTCLGSVPYGEYNEIVHIGSIPVINLSESDPFTVSVEGWSGDLPLITACAAGHPIHEVQGGQFLFNVFLAVTKAEATSPLSVAVHFSAEVTPQTAEDAANYRIIQTTDPAGALSILNAALSSDPTVVLLTLAAPIEPMVEYTTIVSNVRDLAGNMVAPVARASVLIPLAMSHTPIACGVPGRETYVPWQVSDPIHSIARACLYYRTAGTTEWIEQCENNPINPVVMAIPGSDVQAPGVEYYLSATNGIGLTIFHGSPGTPHVFTPCAAEPCRQPNLLLAGYQSISYTRPLWNVRVAAMNAGPGAVKKVNITMNSDVSWLGIPDPACGYGDIPQYGTSFGETDGYTFDLSGHPGGSFNVWFDVVYEDTCGNWYQVRLDPEFAIDAGETGDQVPAAACQLDQNYPNPFNPSTTIAYRITVRSRVIVRVFDVSGKLMRTLIDGDRGPGVHAMEWDGRDSRGAAVASGIYFYRLQAGSYDETKRMVLLR